ncbi:MAG: methyltransferase domain-containing protein [Fimbriimonadaceae bacterium]|nr:methyltransferase domain-containing protein [Chitinophagales bacterium]
MTVVTDELKLSIYEKIKFDSPLYAAMFFKNWKRYKTSAELFISSSGVKQHDTVLDYGCGFPFVVNILTELGYIVTGYEPYAGEDELHITKLLGMEKNYQTKLDLQIQYDHILMIDVIEHLAVIKPLMEEIHRLIKPGGTLFISTPNVMRFDMWKKFVSRKTGHPTYIMKYLKASDNFRNHQREFTMQELLIAVKHFNFNQILLQTIRDTQPSIADLNAYHKLLGDQQTFRTSSWATLQNFILNFFPASFKNNNLFVTARRS